MCIVYILQNKEWNSGQKIGIDNSYEKKKGKKNNKKPWANNISKCYLQITYQNVKYKKWGEPSPCGSVDWA